MAKIDLKFLDIFDDSWIKTNIELGSDCGIEDAPDHIQIQIHCTFSEQINTICLDKSTAIKFAKTLRTEINKMKEI